MTLPTDDSAKELAGLLNRGDDLTPPEMRRLAELHEHYFFNPAEASVWRQRALTIEKLAETADSAASAPADIPMKNLGSVMAPVVTPA
jgi:hypothetical protein